MDKYREEVINIELARLLNKFGLKADPEIIKLRAYPDVLIPINGIKINIEGRFEKSTRVKNLEEDCIERIKEGIADIGVAIYYPENLRESRSLSALERGLRNAKFNITIIYLDNKGLNKYSIQKINIERLVENIENVYNIIIDTDVLINSVKEVDNIINECSTISSNENFFFSSNKFLNELKRILNIENSKKISDIEKKQIVKISLFILFNALVFHEALSTYIVNISSLKKIEKQIEYYSFINDEWDKIIEINFIPIFSIAKQILLSLPSSLITEKILEKLSKQAIKILQSGILLKHDLMGRIYHRLLLKLSGDLYATYYTSISAAWILANLSIKTNSSKFDTLGELEKASIIDPACGSGTLLSAIYNAIKDIHILSSRNINLKRLHEILIKNTINGWDVLDYAGHLTLTTLALHNLKVFFNRSNIYILPVGQVGKDLHLGSLDYIEADRQFSGKGFFALPKRKGIKEEIVEDASIKTGSFDLVIMNPPFSRSAGLINTKFGYAKEDIKKRLNKHLSKLGKKINLSGIGHAGLGAYFIVLGDRFLKDDGIISIVIPRAILSGVSWKKIREILYSKYEIQYIINNHDPGDERNGIEPWNFSENTSLSEVLIVAKKCKDINNKYTTIINLWNKPKNEIESLIVSSQAIKVRKSKESFIDRNLPVSPIRYSKKTIGSAYNISQKYLDYNFLFPALFANPKLNSLTFNLIFNNKIKLCNLENLSKSLGVDRKQVSLSFNKVDYKTINSILWGYPVSLNKISVEDKNFTYVEAKNNNYLKVFNNSSNLLIAEHIFLNNNSLVAVYSDKRVLSTAFWEVKIDENFAKVLALWFNSTFGFILYNANSISSFGPQINMKKDQLKRVKVLDVRELTKKELQKCIQQFDKIKNQKFDRFPLEYRRAYNGSGIKKMVDDFFIELLSLEISLKEYYEILCSEPIISGKRL